MKALRHLNKYLFHHKYWLIAGAVCTILSNVFAIIPGRVIKHAFDLVQKSLPVYQLLSGTGLQKIVYNTLANGLLLCGGMLLLVAMLKGLFGFLARERISITGKRIECALRNEIYAHYQTLPLQFYRENSTGDLMARISEDITQVGMYLGPAMVFGLNSILGLLMLIPYMFFINARLALYTVLPVLLLAVGTYYVSTFMQTHASAIQHQLARLTSFVQESFSGVGVLQAFAREGEFTKAFSQDGNVYKEQSLRLTNINAFFFPATKSIIGLGIVLVVFIGGQEVIQGKSTPGEIAEFVMYVNLLAWPTFSVSFINNLVQKAAASQARINEFLSVKNPIVSEKALKSPIQGHIAFNNVSFTYANTGVKALRSVTFQVAAGKSLAIIGTTGAGKSTMAQLVSRLYDVDSGKITIDGISIQDYDVPFLRQQLGYVAQDVLLFSDTVANNIGWGKPEASSKQIIQAAQLAEVYENIQTFPSQMETMVGERGVTLSGGQKQRIAIARAFIRHPPILVLDDCLSAVDGKTAADILRNIKKAMVGSTTLIISNTVSSAQLADQILVLEKGEIAEKGTHKELLAHKGLYYALCKQQHQQ